MLVAAMSVIMFSAGIVLTTPAGNYWLDIIDTSTGGIPLLIVGLFQFMVVGWGFGGRRWLRKVFKTFFFIISNTISNENKPDPNRKNKNLIAK